MFKSGSSKKYIHVYMSAIYTGPNFPQIPITFFQKLFFNFNSFLSSFWFTVSASPPPKRAQGKPLKTMTRIKCQKCKSWELNSVHNLQF